MKILSKCLIVAMLLTGFTVGPIYACEPNEDDGLVVRNQELHSWLIGKTLSLITPAGRVYFINETDALHKLPGKDSPTTEVNWRIKSASLACIILPAVNPGEICMQFKRSRSGEVSYRRGCANVDNYPSNLKLQKAGQFTGFHFISKYEVAEGNQLQ